MKILLAEDDAVLRCLLEELLGLWGHDVMVADDGELALEVVRQREDFDVAILDWMMPRASGPDVCRTIRDLYTERRPFVLMLTAKSQLEDVIAGLDAGADEYLTKPYRPAELAARLRAAERLMRLQDELIASRRLVAYHALHDASSGALNRAAFLTRLNSGLVEGRRDGRPVSLVRIRVAEAERAELARRVDDHVLGSLVDRLKACVPDDAFVGRVGSHEFLAALPGHDRHSSRAIASAVVHGVNTLPLKTPVGPVTLHVEASFITARDDAELDLAWMLCAVETLSWSPEGEPQLAAS